MKTPSHPASDRVRHEWLRRVEAEYRSAAITQHLTLWLIQIGASPDLISAGLRIVRDEMTHASMSFRVYRAAGGAEGPRLVRESLGLRPSGEPLEADVLRAGVEIFCLGETVAVPLFSAMRRPCSQPAARRALDRVLRDEVRHRDFGWTLLGWLVEQFPPLLDLARAELPAMFRRLRASYDPDAARSHDSIAPAEQTWGLMAPARYGQILARTLERDFIPRFSRLGIDARGAWG